MPAVLAGRKNHLPPKKHRHLSQRRCNDTTDRGPTMASFECSEKGNGFGRKPKPWKLTNSLLLTGCSSAARSRPYCRRLSVRFPGPQPCCCCPTSRTSRNTSTADPGGSHPSVRCRTCTRSPACPRKFVGCRRRRCHRSWRTESKAAGTVQER